MKVFVYGIAKSLFATLRCYFGEGEYIDITSCYQDILALCAYVVVINIDYAPKEIVSTIKEYEQETKKDDDTEYCYVREGELEEGLCNYVRCS